jgi:hypothetical protein
MTETLHKQKAETIAGRLLENAGKVRFGSVSVNLKIHDGRVTGIEYQTAESTREGNE